MFIDFREKKNEKERERERDIDQLLPIGSLTGDQTHNLGMYPDQGSNLQPFCVQDDATSN